MLYHFGVLAFSYLALVSSLPNGAPKCAINPQVIAAGHGTQANADVGYALDLSSKTISPGSPMKIKITNSKGRTDFKGILMYIQGSDPKKHLGQFQSIDTSYFKYQTEACTNLGFAGDAQSTVTHANPSSKPLDKVEFTWMPVPGDELDPGPFTLHAVIATDPVPWQVLEPIVLNGSLKGGIINSTLPVKKRYRCKRRKTA